MPNSFLSEADVAFAISTVCGSIDIAFVMHLRVAWYGSNCRKLWMILHINMMPKCLVYVMRHCASPAAAFVV